MAKQTSRSEEEIIDLTELIEPGHAPAGGGFEDLLAQADASDGKRGTPKAAPAVDPHEELDMNMGDMDNLLDSLDIPPSGGDDAPAGGAKGANMDSVLDDLLDGSTPGAASEKDSFLDDLNSILGEENIPSAPKPASAASTPNGQPKVKPSPDDSMDAILASFDEPPAPKTAGKPTGAAGISRDSNLDASPGSAPGAPARTKQGPVAVPKPDLDAELDDLLGSVGETESIPKKTAPKMPDTAAGSMNAGGSAPANSQKAPMPDLDSELDDLLGSVEDPETGTPSPVSRPAARKSPAQPEKAAPSENFDLPGDLDALLDSPGAPQKAPETLNAASMAAKAAAAAQEIPRAGVSPEDIAEICRNIMSMRDGTENRLLSDLSRDMGAQAARIEDLGRKASELAQKLQDCEARLAEARSRIAVLEKELEDKISIENLLHEESAAHKGISALIAAAVKREIQDLPEKNEYPAMREMVDKLAGGERGINARIDLLEKRLDDLEPSFNHQVEKAAAAAAARILHEEIGNLIKGQ